MEHIGLITGGGSGIGAALAVRLADRGMHVVITGRRKELLELVTQQRTGRITAVQGDISLSEDRQRLVNRIEDIPGHLTHLVHNAAVIEPIRLIRDLTPDEWRHHQAINLEGPLFLTQALLPMLHNARVLHISSGAAHHAYPGWGAYCMSKAALYMLYMVLNEEFKNLDILFGSLRPGIVDTEMQNTIRSSSREDFPILDYFTGLKENGKLIPAGDVARFIEWVLLDTTDDEFPKEEWNIKDTKHFPYWQK